MRNWKWCGAAVLLAAAFVGGYRYAAALYGADVAALREDYARRAQALEVQYREQERQSAAALAAAWEERDRARADAIDLRGELDGVRNESDALRRELSGTGSGSCDALRAQLAECASLCERGAELVERGARELQSVAADKDALAALVGR